MIQNIETPIEIDMVIISWAKNQKLHKETLLCIKSLCESELSNTIKFNIFIVESNKDIYYESLNSKGHSIKTIHTDKPFGYHTYLNLGLKEGNAEWSCLCNNDLHFKPKWATEILTNILVQRNNDYSIWEYVSASPLNPKESWHQQKINKIELGYGVRQHIAGWCLFQSRNIFDKIGELDERIKFWFCDNWYSVALQSNRIPHILVGTSIVEHHSDTEGTTTKDVEMSDVEKHKLTYGAGDNFREVVREMLNDDTWGRPSNKIKERLRKQGREWY